MPKKQKKLKIIPLGGLGEIGKNITAFEYENDIIVVDCGLAFPEDDMLGIDLVIPDVAYLIKHKSRIRGFVLTHGHEDHIGALPYVFKELNVPVYATKLTLGLLAVKLEEHGMVDSVVRNIVKQGETIKLGCFSIEFIRVSHSIADSVALAIRTPVGMIVHTGDFKIDYTPIDGNMMDLGRFAELGKEGVLLLMADSTNIEHPGYTMAESTVGETFDDIFMNAHSRILVATFASNIHRIQQIINSAEKTGKKVAICGRSVENVSKVATELGYLHIPDGVMIDIDKLSRYDPANTVIITTGSQGEPMSALSRISQSEHRKVTVTPGDLVIISASPIPGNEKTISKVINDLFKKGADVIYQSLAEIHVSGHACKEELKLIHSLTNPKYFMPIHGEYRHLQQHKNLAISLGTPEENVFVLEIGEVLELSENSAKINGSVQSGRIFVDGLGVGDVGNVVLRDRKHLSQDGLIIIVITIDAEKGTVIAGPDIITRGFVYVKESDDLKSKVKEIIKKALDTGGDKNRNDWTSKKTIIRDSLKDYIYEKTKHSPMILPIIMEI